MKKYILVLGIVAIMLLASCTQESSRKNTPVNGKGVQNGDTPVKADEPVQKSNEPSAAGEQNAAADNAKPGVKEFNMVARQWEFEPSTITVNEGDKVVLTIKNEDVEHGFAILEFNVNEKLPAGQITKVEFKADKKGEYSFFCSVACGKGHRDMKGKLIVQ